MQRILLIRLDNVGDVVMLGPALRAVRENLPVAHLALLASPAGAQAAPLLPWLDEVLVWRALWQDLGRLPFDPQREWQLVDTLRRGRFDAAFVFTSFSQAPHPPALACHLAGIPQRWGASKERGGILTGELPAPPDALHQAERNLRLVEAAGLRVRDRSLGVCVPPAARRRARELLAGRGVVPGQPYILFSPWASCQARTYFPERFADAARRLAQATGWRVIVAGLEKDRARSAPLLAVLGRRAVDLIGLTGVPELAALVGGARLVLTNDTAAMHLTDATRTPGLVMYSGTELESQWRPRDGPARLLRRPTDCSPCYAFTCPYHLECLDIPAEEVAAAGLALLDDVAGGERDAGWWAGR